MLRRTQKISAASSEVEKPEVADKSPGAAKPAGAAKAADPANAAAASVRKDSRTGPYGVDRRIDPRLKFDAPSAGIEPKPNGADRRVHERIVLETSNSENERRAAKRRQIDAMRAEFQSRIAPEEKQGFLSSLTSRLPSKLALKPTRIILLLVALLTGGLAAVLASRLDQQAGVPAAEIAALVPEREVVLEPRIKVLVASQEIGVGQRLSPASVVWQDWPEGAVLSDYVTDASNPGAATGMGGSVARFEIFPGEPIRTEKLVQADQGYLSAILEPGQRGVSVLVSAASASGGFIVPNDYVDVLLSPDATAGQSSRTVLQNVRVLAINSRLGEIGSTGAPGETDDPRAQMFSEEVIATLALGSAQAEVLIGAAGLGDLTLVLRSMSDFGKTAEAGMNGTNQVIRLTSPFWNPTEAQDMLR